MVVAVPDDVFRKLKLHAAEHDRTLKRKALAKNGEVGDNTGNVSPTTFRCFLLRGFSFPPFSTVRPLLHISGAARVDDYPGPHRVSPVFAASSRAAGPTHPGFSVHDYPRC